MYAIIRSGGKQTKVREGDVIDVERVRGDGEITFTPLLVVDDKGKVFSNREELQTAKVTAKVVGESAGDKVDIFKYKAKTGYRRRQGHRQTYTQLKIKKISKPAAKKAAPAKSGAKKEPAKKPAAKKASTTKKPAAKKAPAKKAAAKKAPAKKDE
jgi:large subunit ribosomal protein L21